MRDSIHVMASFMISAGVDAVEANGTVMSMKPFVVDGVLCVRRFACRSLLFIHNMV